MRTLIIITVFMIGLFIGVIRTDDYYGAWQRKGLVFSWDTYIHRHTNEDTYNERCLSVGYIHNGMQNILLDEVMCFKEII